MTKFKPKTPKESVNYTNEHPLKDYMALILGLFLLLGLAFLCFDFFVGKVIDQITLKQEVEWFGTSSSQLKRGQRSKEKLSLLIDQLWLPFSEVSTSAIPLNVKTISQEEMNAFTGVGANFYFTTGLLKKTKSLNSLVFVACHELGHFYHRHVLRRSSRVIIMNLLFRMVGLGSLGDSLIGVGSEALSLKFSRDDELEADTFALDCQQKYLGHVAGFDEFFISIEKNESKYLSFISTHPKSAARIQELKLQAIAKGFSLEGEIIPWSYEAKEAKASENETEAP